MNGSHVPVDFQNAGFQSYVDEGNEWGISIAINTGSGRVLCTVHNFWGAGQTRTEMTFRVSGFYFILF